MKINLIYILSSGHSGSTVLGGLLGNHENIVHVGELSNLYKVVNGELETCSCKKLPQECSFWSEVLLKFNKELISIQMTLEDYEIIRKKVELNILKKRRKIKELPDYIVLTRLLFQLISGQANKQIIVDSSKSPGRALALSLTFKKQMKIIYLKKNYKGVLSSFKRKKKNYKLSTIKFQYYLLREHYKFLYTLLISKSSHIKFSYNNIFSHKKVLQLFSKLGISNAVSINSELKNYHVIAGNRMRYNNRFMIEDKKKNNVELYLFESLLAGIANFIRNIY